jgi:hypothetical protein
VIESYRILCVVKILTAFYHPHPMRSTNISNIYNVCKVYEHRGPFVNQPAYPQPISERYDAVYIAVQCMNRLYSPMSTYILFGDMYTQSVKYVQRMRAG